MQAAIAEPLKGLEAASLKERTTRALGAIVLFALFGVIALAVVPYGTAEAWWKGAFVCAVFALAILWLIEGYLSGSWLSDGGAVVLPMFALAVFALIQSISFWQTGISGIRFPPWNAISADPHHSRFFAAQMAALMLVAIFLFRYVSTEQRLRFLINLIIGIGVASALFGILRQTAQHSAGFGLPLIAPGQGYGQFVNKNHFAFLMEMPLGLALGLIVGGGVRREQALIYLAALLPLWTALALCGSRGGLIAMLAQLIIAALLVGIMWGRADSFDEESKLLRIAKSLPVRVLLLVALTGGLIVGTLWLGGDRLASKIEESRAQLEAVSQENRTGVNRNEIWAATLKMIAARPFFGVGFGGYWVAVPQYHDASGRMTPQEAHNDYLELVASGGLVGLAIGVWFIVGVVRRIRRNLNAQSRFRRAACLGATIGIAGVAVHSLVDFGLHMLGNAVVFVALLVIATANVRWIKHRTERVA